MKIPTTTLEINNTNNKLFLHIRYTKFNNSGTVIVKMVIVVVVNW